MKVKTWLTMMATALTVFAVQAQEMSDDAIAERIKPVGEVHVAGAAAEGAAAGGGGALIPVWTLKLSTVISALRLLSSSEKARKPKRCGKLAMVKLSSRLNPRGYDCGGG